jgi:gliding motility-associated lipoprotein GldD
MNSLRVFNVFLLLIFMAGCGDQSLVKPEAKLRLQYPSPQFEPVKLSCPFSFDKNSIASIEVKKNCAVNIHYPKMKATVYLTYQLVNDNLNDLLSDAQKLTYDHTVKANEIFEQPRVDSIHKVYGMFYMINGDAATQTQFYATDSVKHFLTGSLYFKSKPNFDSIYPAVVYIRDDIRRIMETITWN